VRRPPSETPRAGCPLRIRSVPLVMALFVSWATVAAPEPALAQGPQYGTGLLFGAGHIGPLNPDAASFGEGDAQEILPATGPLVAIHVDRWYGVRRRFGIRVQFAFQQPRFEWTTSEPRSDVYSGDLSVLLRAAPSVNSVILPYVAGGFGGIWYDLDRLVGSHMPEADAYYDQSSRVRPAGIVAFGLDLPSPWEWGRQPLRIRMEVADHVALDSPFRRISNGARYGPIHHIRFTVGLHSVVER
jgi:hypothetical protein